MFDEYELSPRGGRPRQLFIFTMQGLTQRYTGGQKDVTIGGNTYLAAPISRSEIKQTIEKTQDSITITFAYTRDPDAAETPATQPLGDWWHPYIPGDPVSVICLEYHAGDPDAQAVVKWQGVASQPKFTDGQIELTCDPNDGTDAIQGNGPKWQKTCWKTPYSGGLRGCNMLPADFESTGTLSAVNGLVLSAPEFAGLPLSLAGGKVYFTRADGLVVQRSIMAHNGTDITVLYGSADFEIGLLVTVRPSCERTWAACTARNRTIDFGGSVYKPIQNPYSGEVSMSWG